MCAIKEIGIVFISLLPASISVLILFTVRISPRAAKARPNIMTTKKTTVTTLLHPSQSIYFYASKSVAKERF
jgi:hypothetical protein